MGDQPPKILVVDDVPENVRLLEAVLASRGYDVVAANDGLAALEVVHSEQPDLILLDVMMPGLDGYAVCRRLREHDDTAVLPEFHAAIGPLVKRFDATVGSCESAATTSTSAPASPSATRRAARSASRAGPTTRQSAR